jgi:ribosomal protein L32
VKKKPTKQWIRARRVHWQDKWKIKNSCQICGYNKNPRALCFDHLKSSEKHSLAKNASNRGLIGGGMWHLTHADIPRRDMINEWRKCRILCSNCHMEETYPLKNITKKKNIIRKLLEALQNWDIGGLNEDRI